MLDGWMMKKLFFLKGYYNLLCLLYNVVWEDLESILHKLLEGHHSIRLAKMTATSKESLSSPAC